MNKAEHVGLTALQEASAIRSSIRIVSNDVTITPAHSEKNSFQAGEECGQHKLVLHLLPHW